MDRSTPLDIPAGTSRWMAFYAVGAMGMAVQLAAVWALTSGIELDYLASTVIGVELAVIHNFIWHERWTWADRVKGRRTSALTRLARFNIASGLLSMLGNVVLVRLFVTGSGTTAVVANVLAIATCSVLNFLVADTLVYRRGTHP